MLPYLSCDLPQDSSSRRIYWPQHLLRGMAAMDSKWISSSNIKYYGVWKWETDKPRKASEWFNWKFHDREATSTGLFTSRTITKDLAGLTAHRYQVSEFHTDLENLAWRKKLDSEFSLVIQKKIFKKLEIVYKHPKRHYWTILNHGNLLIEHGRN